MKIAIKSEVDSRVLLYPMLRCLQSYGSILVITNNRQLCRLIDGEIEGSFRNIRIIYDEGGAVDDTLEQYGIADGDYDFEIQDNMGTVEYDLMLIPLGALHSESFDDEIMLLKDDENVKLVQFGKSAKGSSDKGSKSDKKDKKSKERKSLFGKKSKSDSVAEMSVEDMGEVIDDYDPAAKFHERAEDIQKKDEGKSAKTPMVPFPTYQQIEDLEGTHKFYDVDKQMVDVLYNIFKDVLGVDKMVFSKEAKIKDESSGYIKSRNSTRED